MSTKLGFKIICEDDLHTRTEQTVLSNLIVKSDNNGELLYVDGVGDAGTPIYLGLTKSRGIQDNKLPVEAGDILGGIQSYARIKEGTSLGYNKDTPLVGSLMFKVADDYDALDSKMSTELLVAVGDKDSLTIRLVLDSQGNLKVSGNVSAGKLTITDKVVQAGANPVKFIKAIYNGREYAIPLHLIQ